VNNLNEQQGSISYRALDAGDNVAVSVTCYHSRATADAASAEAAAWAQRNLSRLQPIDVTLGEVLVEASADNGDARSHPPT
jgi:hypothetical protein